MKGELEAALNNPNVKGSEAYHIERMIDVGVAHELLTAAMAKTNLSFADFPNASNASNACGVVVPRPRQHFCVQVLSCHVQERRDALLKRHRVQSRA